MLTVAGFCNAAALTAMNGFSGIFFETKVATPCELTAMNGFSGLKLDAAPCMLTGINGFSGVDCFTTPCVLTEQVGFFVSEEEEILNYSTN